MGEVKLFVPLIRAMSNKEIPYRSDEMEAIAKIPVPAWRKKLLLFLSRLLNARFDYPYRWRYEGKKMGRPSEKRAGLYVKFGEDGKVIEMREK